MSTSWEYMVLEMHDTSGSELGIQLSPLGEEGWELVAVIDDGHRFIFKRGMGARVSL